MNLSSNKTLTETIQDMTKAALILKNSDADISTTGKNILNDAVKIPGKRSEKNLNELTNSKDIRINYMKINDWSLEFLCDFIVSNHHKYIRKILPAILSACKIYSGKKHGVSELYTGILQLKNDFEIHMQKEEKLLFPYIKKMNNVFNDKAEYEIPPFGSVLNLIKVFEKEHITADRSLIIIKKMFRNSEKDIKDYSIKKILSEYLNEFITDFHFHIHLENNVLFPKAVSLEKKLKKNSKNINHK